jgi:hypothetical protein
VAVSDEKNPVEQALDVLLYAPIGLLFSARELLPTFVQKGRSQLALAKMMGQHAAKEGGQMAESLLGKAQQQAMATLETLANGNGSNRRSGAATARTNGSAPSSPAPEPDPAASPSSAPPVIEAVVVETPVAPTSGPEAVSLAIPDYDSLSASQVLPRLNGLADDELEAVRAYEAAHRGRKTILNRAAQLQASTS